MLNTEHEAFARMLGSQMVRYPEDCLAFAEFIEIARWRFSRMVGHEVGSPAFEAAWSPVMDRAAAMDDGTARPTIAPDQAPDEADYLDMPFLPWRITDMDDAERVLQVRTIHSRTCEEAVRRAMADRAPGATGWMVGGAQDVA